jgi:hypothetical protein
MTADMSGRRARRLIAMTLAVGLALGLGACGLPKDGGPREIAADKVPFDLLLPESPAGAAVPAGALTATTYFMGTERLRAVQRDVPIRDYASALTALLAGTTEADPQGLTTSIPSATRLLGVDVDAFDPSILVINLSPEFFAVVGPAQIQEYAQLVYTATEFDAIKGVRFLNNGQPVQALTAAGELRDGAVNRDDYLALQPAPDAPPATPTTQG